MDNQNKLTNDGRYNLTITSIIVFIVSLVIGVISFIIDIFSDYGDEDPALITRAVILLVLALILIGIGVYLLIKVIKSKTYNMLFAFSNYLGLAYMTFEMFNSLFATIAAANYVYSTLSCTIVALLFSLISTSLFAIVLYLNKGILKSNKYKKIFAGLAIITAFIAIACDLAGLMIAEYYSLIIGYILAIAIGISFILISLIYCSNEEYILNGSSFIEGINNLNKTILEMPNKNASLNHEDEKLTIIKELEGLKSLLDKGIISQEEYEEKRQKLINKI